MNLLTQRCTLMFIELGATKIRKPANFRAWPDSYNGKKLILAVRSHSTRSLNRLISFFITFKAGTSMFITSERVPIMEFLSMEVPTSIAFILRAPPISYVSNIYYLPFTGVVWICLISLVVLSTFVIALTLEFLVKHDEGAQRMKLSDYLLFAIASTCQMGSNVFTNILSARISIVSRRMRSHFSNTHDILNHTF